MASSKSFSNVTQEIWDCVKTTTGQEHGTTYDPPGSNKGTSTTKTIVGTVELGFDFDPVTTIVNYTIIKKPFIVPESEIWDGIQSTINGCTS
jgi:hypothetical protein